MDDSTPPIACTLGPSQAAAQTLEWADLRSVAASVAPLTDGARLAFPLEHRAAVDDLVARESACCAFLDIRTTVEDDQLVVDITSPNPDARPVIAMLSGLELA